MSEEKNKIRDKNAELFTSEEKDITHVKAVIHKDGVISLEPIDVLE